MYEAFGTPRIGQARPLHWPTQGPLLMIPLSPQSLRLLLNSAAWALAVSSFAGVVAAQAVKPTIQAIDRTQITRNQPMRAANDFPYWVSRQDCLADDEITFKVQVTRPNADQFEVWAGTADCTQKTERQGANANCWRVYSKNLTKSPASITIRAQDFVAQNSIANGGSLGDQGTDQDCTPKYLGAGLYFMYVNDSGDVSSNAVKFTESGVDTEGPVTPEVTEVLPSDGRLIVNWANNNPTEFAGYRLYCTRAVETETSESALTLADGAVVDAAVFGTGSGDGVGGDASPDGASNDAATGVATGVPTDGGGGGAVVDGAVVDAGEMGTPGCGGSSLVEGTFPDPSRLCGEVDSFSTTTGYANDLTNGRSYAVGLTAVDRLGNESYLSNVVCNSPREVFTFYEDYKDAGGGGGGGFCSAARAPSPAGNSWQVFGLFSFAICLGLLRRINNT